MQPQNITIITDCCDHNAQSRQEARYATLFPQVHLSFIGTAPNTLEAAGNIIDTLDAMRDGSGVIAANVAPRSGEAQMKWPNGTPFGYVWIGDTLLVATVDGYLLSLLKKLNITDHIMVTDIETVMREGGYDEDRVQHAALTQFRSFNYLPYLAKIAWDKRELPGERLEFSDIPDAPEDNWWIDVFGNCKTTLLAEDVGFEDGKKVTVSVGGKEIVLPCHTSLKDVPHGEPALTHGSSGFNGKRFLEIVVQGKSAAEHFGFERHTGFRD